MTFDFRLLVLLASLLAIPSVARADESKDASDKSAIAAYYAQLEKLGLIDIDTGTREALSADVRVAEELLNQNAIAEAAVALYGIVESPRYSDLDEFVEYHNAEYYLGVALTRSGAHDSALVYLLRAIARGPKSLYFAPAHRRAVDIAIETRGFQKVLDMLEDVDLDVPLPPDAVGERAYLVARIAYEKGDFAAAEGQLARISRKSRLYTSALYLRGVIRTRKGQFGEAAEALCEVADTPDNDRFTFVVDDRYFRIKDLARLGLGRIAHEVSEYDDAYYHYFQIPEDSDRLPEALFEASWSMYQKRELDTARDLAVEFGKTFPDSPLWPEARLLTGYIELADCEFDAAQKHYDALVAELQPIVDELDRIRADPQLRASLFERAVERRRAERADPQNRIDRKPTTPADQVLALLRIDPQYLKLHEAMTGLRSADGQARLAVRAWSRLGRRLGRTEVGKIAAEESLEKEEAADLTQIVEDTRRLSDTLAARRIELRRAVREKTVTREEAAEEQKRLDALAAEIDVLERDAIKAARSADTAATTKAPAGLKPMVERDLGAARALVSESRQLERQLSSQADAITKASLDKLWAETRRVLDKAKLGKIDAVIGQKRRLEIEVQDLAAGRFPPELFGKMWEKGLIGDDEEWWPFEGEYWKDEYEGYR